MFELHARISGPDQSPAELEPLRAAEALMHRTLDICAQEKDASQADRAAHYHLECGGQRIRARLALTSALALGLRRPDAVALAAASELIHNASLVHDDIVDREEYRRGDKTVVAAYGPNIAICTGDLLLSASYAVLGDLSLSGRIPSLIRSVFRAASLTIHGQCSEFTPLAKSTDPWQDYASIARAKSGALLALPLELALIAAEQTVSIPTARKCAESFAVAYQIFDDIHDLDKDRGDGVSPNCYNALLILEAQGHAAGALALASRLAKDRLLETIELADAIPNQSGKLLADLAKEMLGQIP
jgi:geranylgeranyl pyrophosphate synthase